MNERRRRRVNGRMEDSKGEKIMEDCNPGCKGESVAILRKVRNVEKLDFLG